MFALVRMQAAGKVRRTGAYDVDWAGELFGWFEDRALSEEHGLRRRLFGVAR